MEISETTAQLLGKVVEKKIKGMKYILEKKASSIKNKEAFEKTQEAYLNAAREFNLSVA